VDLRGHGDSPRAEYGLTLDDLTEDLHEMALELLGRGERIDVLLGHSLGALTALRLCGERGDLVERLVLEEPPSSENAGFDEVARMVESDVARAREAPDQKKREQLEENPSWTEEDAANNVASLRDCDVGPIAEMMRNDLRYDLSALVGSIEVPTLIVLGSEARGSPSPSPSGPPSRTCYAAAGWRRSIPATACTGKTSRATSGSWVSGSENRDTERPRCPDICRPETPSRSSFGVGWRTGPLL